MSDLLNLLRQTGLNEYESRAYAALLEADTATAADVSRKANIPRARVYDILVGLEKKGFLLQEPGRPVRFKAFHPETALSNLERQRKAGFAEELSALGELKKALAKHADSVKKSSVPEGETAFLVSGAANIEAKLRELLKDSATEAIICTNEANAAKKAGLLNRILRESSLSIPVRFYSPLGEKISAGKELQQSKNVEFLPSANCGRFMVFDGKKTLLFLNHEQKESDKALLIESPSIARFLKATIK